LAAVVCWNISPPAQRIGERLRIFETKIAERIAILVSESRYGMGMPQLVARTGLLEVDIQKRFDQRGFVL